MGHTIAISSSTDAAAITLKDIAFGDVFVCAGQSHMTFSVNQDMNGSTEIAASGNFDYSFLDYLARIPQLYTTLHPRLVMWFTACPGTLGPDLGVRSDVVTKF